MNWFTRGPLDKPEIKRYLDFLNEAVRLKGTGDELERLYIEAWAASFTGDSYTLGGKERAVRRRAAGLEGWYLDTGNDRTLGRGVTAPNR